MIEPVEKTVLVEFQLTLCGGGVLLQSLAQLIEESLDVPENLARVAPHPVRIGHLEAPDRLFRNEFVSQGLALELEKFWQEWVAVAQPGDRLEEGLLSGGQECHTRIV